VLLKSVTDKITKSYIFQWKFRKYRKQHKVRLLKVISSINASRDALKNAKEANLTIYVKIINVGLFIQLVEYDFILLIHQYLRGANLSEWEQKYYARQVAALLYEASYDVPRLLGKEFRDCIGSIPLWENATSEVNSILKGFYQFKEHNNETLKEIRNCLAAHKDKNAELQLEIIEKLEPLDMMQLLSEFYSLLNSLVPFLTRVVKTLCDPNVLLQHYSEGNIESSIHA
jgi:hypothetical protein